MEDIINLLKAREEQLQKLKTEKEKALDNVPSGTLRVNKHRNKVQYFHRTSPNDHNGVYISLKDNELACKLAQKDYDSKVLHSIEEEIKAIKAYLSRYPKRAAEQIYENMHIERRKLITPIRELDEEYIKKWESEKYERKEFYEDVPEFFTEKGERVRSKSEIIIADMLARQGIPYKYECPLWLKGIGRVHPDFTVLNVRLRKEIYWEHLGMMDDISYSEYALQKINYYQQNKIYPGDRLILTHETRKSPINQKIIKEIIGKYFQ